MKKYSKINFRLDEFVNAFLLLELKVIYKVGIDFKSFM
jgi:hypothetical protein